VSNLKKVQNDRCLCIQNCVSSILKEIDYKKNEGMQANLRMQTQKAITSQLIPELINNQFQDLNPERLERLPYSLTLKLNKKIDQLPDFYVPSPKVEFIAYERLAIPALIGAVIIGLISYYTLGSFFKEELFAPLIGMPLGAALFVWLFSKSIRHPRISKALKWTLISGLTVFSIGTLFSGLKKSVVFKPRISFLQWLWVAILTLFTFWILHLFKPQMVNNEKEVERSLSAQLTLLLRDIWDLCITWTKNGEDIENTKTTTPQLETHQLFGDSQLITSSIDQMLFAQENQDKEAALMSINSFLNSLRSLGIHERVSEPVFTYQKGDAEYYDVFGIVHEGDVVEPIYDAWVDDQGRCFFRGKVKKVRK